MTWEQLRQLDLAKTVTLLPVGAVEAHGPHLPLSTDVIIAQAMARAAAELLASQGREVVLLPTVTYTSAGFASGFPGTISLRPETVTATIVEIATSLAAHGAPVLGIANAHLDPAHIAAIHDAVRSIRAGGLLRVAFPDITRRPWAARLGAEFRSGACHAGRYESSIVMAARPELVRDEVRAGLPPNPRSLSDAIRAGLASFEAAGGPEAYFGAPADASAAEGAATIETLGRILVEALADEPRG